MFGTFRYFLALTVVFGHLWPNKACWAAHYAVFAFYVLSGYLITRILKEVYPYSRDGLKRFCVNRFLRLYPTYIAVFLLNLLLLHIAPDDALNMSWDLHMPTRIRHWLANIFIFGLTSWRTYGVDTVMSPRLVNNAWSLNIELWFYLILALGVMRNVKLVLLWLGLAIAHLIYAFSHNYDFFDRYLPVTAGLLPFALGSTLYFVVKRWPCSTRISLILGGTGLYAWIFLPFISSNEGNRPINAWVEGLYISLVISALILYALANLRPKDSPRWAPVDIWLGNLSYPIFLCHFTAEIGMKWAFPGLDQHDGTLFAASLVPVNLLAWLLYKTIDHPLEKARARVRPHAITSSDSVNGRST